MNISNEQQRGIDHGPFETSFGSGAASTPKCGVDQTVAALSFAANLRALICGAKRSFAGCHGKNTFPPLVLTKTIEKVFP